MVRSVRNPADPSMPLVPSQQEIMQCCNGSTGHTVLDEKTNLVVPRRRSHCNLDVLQACRLGCGPVDAIRLGS